MFKKLIDYSISHKLVIGVPVLALVAWGLWSLMELPFDSTPDITDNQVQVITQAPSLGAQEVEQYITTPLEMAMANIPKLKERRSISRSGLSVITLVFDDNADIYWARSQVSQVLEEAEKDLPKNSDVSMGPIATALGEIYHYTIHAKKGYEDKFSLTQLRTYQDWIVRKHLSGTPGVAEVSGWGGYVKQYEVAINSSRLEASGVTVSEVYDALEKNNANTGGSYIEQNANQYFIRGIGVARSLDDLRNIAVKTVNGIPVRVSDVADVRMGHATRFGAVPWQLAVGTRRGKRHTSVDALCLRNDECLWHWRQPDEPWSNRLRDDCRFDGYNCRGGGNTHQHTRHPLRTQMVIKGWNPYHVDRGWNDGNFMGFEIGVGIPIFNGATRARVKAARKEREQLSLQIKNEVQLRKNQYLTATNNMLAARRQLDYYSKTGNVDAEKTARISALAYENGEISYIEYVAALQQSIDTQLKYASAVNDYNQAAIKLKTLAGTMR